MLIILLSQYLSQLLFLIIVFYQIPIMSQQVKWNNCSFVSRLICLQVLRFCFRLKEYLPFPKAGMLSWLSLSLESAALIKEYIYVCICFQLFFPPHRLSGYLLPYGTDSVIRSRNTFRIFSVMLLSLINTTPEVKVSSPVSILNIVVFPAPFNPSNPKHSYFWTKRETFLTAITTGHLK